MTQRRQALAESLRRLMSSKLLRFLALNFVKVQNRRTFQS